MKRIFPLILAFMCVFSLLNLPANACCGEEDAGRGEKCGAYLADKGDEAIYFAVAEDILPQYDVNLTTCAFCGGSLTKETGMIAYSNRASLCSKENNYHIPFEKGIYMVCTSCRDRHVDSVVWVQKVSYGVICTAKLHSTESSY